jgi:hypothetical protein
VHIAYIENTKKTDGREERIKKKLRSCDDTLQKDFFFRLRVLFLIQPNSNNNTPESLLYSYVLSNEVEWQ